MGKQILIMTKNIASFKHPQQFLTSLFEEPGFIKIIRGMDSNLLRKLINHVGLEDAGEIIAFATTRQLENIFDADLWKSDEPGKEEMFDSDRFAIWLNIMVDISDSFAAGKLMALDEDLVTLALCKHIWVIDMETLVLRMTNSDRSVQDDLADKVLENFLSVELDEYYIISRNYQSWDAIVSVLLELDRKDHSFLYNLLERICCISTEYIEDNDGLYNVLTSEEMLECDIAADRENRRDIQGFVSPSTAVTFLGMAQMTSLQEIEKSETGDYITRSYFDRMRHKIAGNNNAIFQHNSDKMPVYSKKLAGFYEKLQEAGILIAPDQISLPDYGNEDTGADSLTSQAIRIIRKQQPDFYTQCLMELNYLANILIAGYPAGNRRLRPMEAAEKVVLVCDLGLEYMLGNKTSVKSVSLVHQAVDFLKHENFVKVFRAGWHIFINND